METGHNTEEEGGLSVEVFSDSIHCLSVLWGESEVSSLLNHRAEHVTQTSDLQQALVNLGRNRYHIQWKGCDCMAVCLWYHGALGEQDHSGRVFNHYNIHYIIMLT